jgi:transposase
MMGRHNRDQGELFYSFDLDAAVPRDHLVIREVAAVLDLSWVYDEMAPHYPSIGRPSIDPVLMIRMLTATSSPSARNGLCAGRYRSTWPIVGFAV